MISSGQFSVVGESVLELGAGSGLPGILTALEGAEFVVLSDYESPTLIANLKRNVALNIPETLECKVKVEGHIWGGDDINITRYAPVPSMLKQTSETFLSHHRSGLLLGS